MKEFSKEIINIGGVDYTLFLNRKGIVAWESITKASQMREELEEKLKSYKADGAIEIKDGDNPFEIAQVDMLMEAEEQTKTFYKKLFWIMLYEEHKLNYVDVEKLFEQAEKEYGYEALMELATQMIEDANKDLMESNELKKLAALKPKKK